MPIPEPRFDTGPGAVRASDRRILVVEDDRSLALLVVYMLEREGFEVASASDGISALAAVRELRPRLVVLDLTLPGMSGDEVCRAMRADPNLADTFVLVLTALDDREARRRVRDAGADCYMCKPFDPGRVLDIVSDVFRGEAAERPTRAPVPVP